MSRAETLGRGVDSLLFVWAWDASAGAGELWLGGAIMAPRCSGKLLFRDFVHTSLFQKTNAEYMDEQLSATITPLHWRRMQRPL